LWFSLSQQRQWSFGFAITSSANNYERGFGEAFRLKPRFAASTPVPRGGNVDTIYQCKPRHPEFAEALKVGKAETDDLVERATVAGISGYYVTVDEMDRFGNVKQLRKWIPGNPHAGMKWLAARRPEQYRERKEDKRILSMDEAFLKFLEQIDEEQKREKALNAPRQVIELKAETVIEAEAVEVKRDDGAAQAPECETSGCGSAPGRCRGDGD
jgi:hypothetical protein